MIRAIISFLRFALFPVGGRNCKFEPTCSAYAAKVIEDFGFFIGCKLAVKRMLKCGPFSGTRGDYWIFDPPPVKKDKSNM